MILPPPDSSHRTRSNLPPIPAGLCGVAGCVFLIGHAGLHSWETGTVTEQQPSTEEQVAIALRIAEEDSELMRRLA